MRRASQGGDVGRQSCTDRPVCRLLPVHSPSPSTKNKTPTTEKSSNESQRAATNTPPLDPPSLPNSNQALFTVVGVQSLCRHHKYITLPFQTTTTHATSVLTVVAVQSLCRHQSYIYLPPNDHQTLLTAVVGMQSLCRHHN